MRPHVCKNQNNSEGDTSAKCYAIVPYIRGVAEPIKRILSNCNINVALKPYLTLGHIFAKPKDPVKQIRKLMLYILYHAVTARKSISEQNEIFYLLKKMDKYVSCEKYVHKCKIS
jgi:hypothetical protein